MEVHFTQASYPFNYELQLKIKTSWLFGKVRLEICANPGLYPSIYTIYLVCPSLLKGNLPLRAFHVSSFIALTVFTHLWCILFYFAYCLLYLSGIKPTK